MASHVPTAMESQLSTMASARLRLRPSPTMVSMEPMVSQLSPPMDTQVSTTMASALPMLRPRPSPTMVSMELMVSQLSPPTDTQLSTTMASAMLMLMPSPTIVSTYGYPAVYHYGKRSADADPAYIYGLNTPYLG